MAVLFDAAPPPPAFMEKKTMMMGSPRGARSYGDRPWRWAKTLFFVATMLASLLLDCAPPLLVVVLDLLLPAALLSAAAAAAAAAASGSPSSATTLSQQMKGFRFGSSLIDIPIVSTARSFVVLCAFLVCDGSRGVYMAITAICSSASAAYVMAKLFLMNSAAAAASASGARAASSAAADEKDAATAVDALFLASVGMAIAHVVAAYRTSCRERRKLLVYRIDVEAVRVKGGLIRGDGKL